MRLFLFLLSGTLLAAGSGDIVSLKLDTDAPLVLDPNAPLWRKAEPVYAAKGRWGEAVPGSQPTEIRSRWSDRYLYLLYTCPYQELYLKPNPVTNLETNHLWDWDVAEAFIGVDPNHIDHYTEYEVSPQGEWVDLDINRSKPAAPAIAWDSGFEARARIDAAHHVWYAAMKIPFAALGVKPPPQLRINLYRIEGPPPDRRYFTWQPTQSETFHVPAAFGRMVLK